MPQVAMLKQNQAKARLMFVFGFLKQTRKPKNVLVAAFIRPVMA